MIENVERRFDFASLFSALQSSSRTQNRLVKMSCPNAFMAGHCQLAKQQSHPPCAAHKEMSSRLVKTGCATALKGVELLRDPFKNRGLDFTEMQRREHKLTGLLPALVDSGSAFQERLNMARLQRIAADFDKYEYLMHLYDSNRGLFFRLMNRYTAELMPLVYTPTVGAACQEYSLVHQNGRGLFIPITESGNIRDLLRNWPYVDKVKVIVVTDGERILGLGDLGSFGMGIPVGKLALCTGLAGVPSDSLLPIVIDVGTNNDKLLSSPLYFGLRQRRVTGEAYDSFVDEFLQACVDVFGKDVLIQFEDFGNHNAFRFLKKYREKYCTFNDDIQGTASVILSGMLTACRATGRRLKEENIVCFGAGESMIGFANLLVECLKSRSGLSEEEAKSHLWMVDSRGLIVEGRSSGGITAEKAPFARPAGSVPEIKDLKEIIVKAKATTLIGASVVPGAFNDQVLTAMAKQCSQPLIFALSNPTHKSECTALAAYRATKGSCIFASGSPFAPLTLDASEVPPNMSLSRKPGQANNAYIFPGLVLGISSANIHPVTEEDFIVAAEALSENVDEADLCQGSLYPPWDKIRGVSLAIARQVAHRAFAQNRVWLKRCDGQEGGLREEDIDAAILKMASYPDPPLVEKSASC
ncbi:NADP-dependent malic enzyme [Echinococcus granulosus]|uniref:Malic enzyme n=1 Tax=Echinococcus granulosus TaxID=6210 RepID=A0A068WSZ0_ECHGR|nr:NADP-dependent malic enzyme [Echinococcus granulosus]CDS20746.1 NADP dependent malic enzyme [Echinococcus granulosus]